MYLPVKEFIIPPPKGESGYRGVNNMKNIIYETEGIPVHTHRISHGYRHFLAFGGNATNLILAWTFPRIGLDDNNELE